MVFSYAICYDTRGTELWYAPTLSATTHALLSYGMLLREQGRPQAPPLPLASSSSSLSTACAPLSPTCILLRHAYYAPRILYYAPRIL
eukprot:3932886-Rhodomonas_salina.5